MSLSNGDIIWFAGVLDARAHMRLEANRGHPQPRLRVTTNRLSLLQAMSQMTGTKVRVDDKGYSRTQCAVHCGKKHVHIVSQSSYWNADCNRATIILFNCLPYLKAQKDEAQTLYDVGIQSYSATRNGTAGSMQRLGWALPVLVPAVAL